MSFAVRANAEFEFDKVTTIIGGSEKWITVTATFHNVKSDSIIYDNQNFVIGFDGNLRNGKFNAIRFSENSFEIPRELSHHNQPGKFFLADYSVKSGAFKKLYNHLDTANQSKIDGACNYFNDIKAQTNLLAAPTWRDAHKAFLKSEKAKKSLSELTQLCVDATKKIGFASIDEMFANTKKHTFKNKVYVKTVQASLKSNGYAPGPVDGLWGPKTEKALKLWALDRGTFTRFEFENLISTFLNSTLSAVDETNIPLMINKGFHSTTSLPEYSNDATIVHGTGVADLFGDGKKTIFLCSTTYVNFVDHPVVVLKVENDVAVDITDEIFSGDVPTINQCTAIYFVDLNGDALLDVVYADAGRDAPPWTGTAIEVALNTGDGLKRITRQFEDATWGIRAYSIAAGNIDNDKFGEIILSSGTDAEKSVILQFNADGVTLSPNKFVGIDQWWDVNNATNMQVFDFDNDGKNDIFVGGNFSSPSNRIFWSGLNSDGPQQYSDTPLGHYSGNWRGDKRDVTGADVTASAIADFDNDGDLDIVNAYEHLSGRWSGDKYQITYGRSYLQVLEQTSKRHFSEVDVGLNFDLGERYFLPAILSDLNNDGFVDIILNYWSKNAGSWATEAKFGSVVMINKGEMNFQKIEADQIGGYNSDVGGMLFPINEIDGGARVLVLQPYSGSRSSNRRLISYTAHLVFKNNQ
ncbi:FG-GAP-like repeat-containing protein [Planktomarina temperata]|nr:FG-GAP-like repeat-containing protein [Planktomarina temperata]